MSNKDRSRVRKELEIRRIEALDHKKSLTGVDPARLLGDDPIDSLKAALEVLDVARRF